MSLGILINCFAVLSGALLGSVLKKHLFESLHLHLPTLFGICSIGIAINSIILATNMTAVVLAVLVGFCIGEILKLEQSIQSLFSKIFSKMPIKENLDMEAFITVVALFSASGFSWYAILTESITGSFDIILSKSILDFFTALLFGAVLGRRLAVIPFFQLLVLSIVYLIGQIIAPYISNDLFLNLSACGGILTFVAGLRVAKIKSVPILNLLPALILVMPFTVLFDLVV